MMLRPVFVSLLALAWALGCTQPAFAQASNFGMFGSQDEEPPEPPQDLPPLPEGADQYIDPLTRPEQQTQQNNAPKINPSTYYQQQKPPFPMLPPSRPCVTADMIGQWKLTAVHEDPPGAEASAFSTNRYQYLLFEKDSIYAKYSSATVSLPPNLVRNTLLEDSQNGLHQYVVGDGGLVYFYNQGIAVDSQVCFIVANERGDFIAGEMIMMPPKGQIKGRLAKVYIRYTGNNQKRPAGGGR